MKPSLIGTPVDSAIKELGAIAEIRVNFSGPLSSHRKQKGQINGLASLVMEFPDVAKFVQSEKYILVLKGY